MKIAYGTYAMPSVTLEDAIPALAAIGYEGVEIAVGPRHAGSLPADMTTERRRHLRRLLDDHGLGIPALFAPGRHVLTDDDEEHRANLAFVRVLAEMARDLGVEDPPVLALGFGGTTAEWDGVKHTLVGRLRDYDALGRELDVIVAGEAHVNAAVDRSERALWLIEQVGSPRVRLHFDMVHFFLAGELPDEAVPRLLPITAHTHVMDARRHPDGSFDLLLLGDGELDAAAYVRAMDAGGWKTFITLEVSVRLWSRAEFDPIAAAETSYRALDRAFQAAGVPRG